MGNYVSTSEAAIISGLSTRYIRQLCKQGRIESKKFGASLMVNKASLMAHVKSTSAWRAKRNKGSKGKAK